MIRGAVIPPRGANSSHIEAGVDRRSVTSADVAGKTHHCLITGPQVTSRRQGWGDFVLYVQVPVHSVISLWILLDEADARRRARKRGKPHRCRRERARR